MNISPRPDAFNAAAGSCWGLIDQTLEVPARDLIDGEG